MLSVYMAVCVRPLLRLPPLELKGCGPLRRKGSATPTARHCLEAQFVRKLSPEGRSSAYLGGLTGTAARQAPLSEDVADRNVAAGQRLGGETLPATIGPNRPVAALDRLAVD